MKRAMRLTIAASLGLLALSGCANLPRAQSRAPSPQRPLASPAAAGERAVSQVVRGGTGKREMTLSCVVSVKDGVMSVVGLNAMGVRLFTISYDGKLVQVEKAFAIPEAITPERLLADLQLVYWPLQPLRETLRPAGFEVSEPAPGARRLRRGDRWIAEVHYASGDAWSGRAWLVNLEFGYSLQMDSQPL
jgi:hypothetical protein